MGPAIGGVLIQAIGSNRPAGHCDLLHGACLVAGATLTRHLVRTAIIFSGLGALAGRSVLETLPILANGVFGKGPAGLGMMTAAAGAGALSPQY